MMVPGKPDIFIDSLNQRVGIESILPKRWPESPEGGIDRACAGMSWYVSVTMITLPAEMPRLNKKAFLSDTRKRTTMADSHDQSHLRSVRKRFAANVMAQHALVYGVKSVVAGGQPSFVVTVDPSFNGVLPSQYEDVPIVQVAGSAGQLAVGRVTRIA